VKRFLSPEALELNDQQRGGRKHLSLQRSRSESSINEGASSSNSHASHELRNFSHITTPAMAPPSNLGGMDRADGQGLATNLTKWCVESDYLIPDFAAMPSQPQSSPQSSPRANGAASLDFPNTLWGFSSGRATGRVNHDNVTKTRTRGSYKCSKCGLSKNGHKCKFKRKTKEISTQCDLEVTDTKGVIASMRSRISVPMQPQGSSADAGGNSGRAKSEVILNRSDLMPPGNGPTFPGSITCMKRSKSESGPPMPSNCLKGSRSVPNFAGMSLQVLAEGPNS